MLKATVTLTVLFSASLAVAQSLQSQPSLGISQLTITGVSHLSSTQMQPIIDEVRSFRYAPGEAGEIKQRVAYAFQELGYLEVDVGAPDVSIVATPEGTNALRVSVSVLEGQQLRLKRINLIGAKAFPDDQLRRQFPISDGEVFNTELIRKGLENL